ncbi:uncharacterized protein SCHCODRAFT_02644720 [Schizophyllum commune H4-8]|nr:uncharacterized protein SCHCODRAFT_02644720 [Schizophyllum commune H4-8]KAI5885428.1 hypothetical protein SCHCODRAFT_02644720 [Schizophyllum commune H4-8]
MSVFARRTGPIRRLYTYVLRLPFGLLSRRDPPASPVTDPHHSSLPSPVDPGIPSVPPSPLHSVEAWVQEVHAALSLAASDAASSPDLSCYAAGNSTIPFPSLDEPSMTADLRGLQGSIDSFPENAHAPCDPSHTFISTDEITVSEGPFPGLKLHIHVGPKRNADAVPLADAMSNFFMRGVASSHHCLTQLYVSLEHATVRGGRFMGEDALYVILRHMSHWLRLVLSVHINYQCPDELSVYDPSIRYELVVRESFCRLRRLRLEGKTGVRRLSIFPLVQLRQLEIAFDIGTAGLAILLYHCGELDMLFVRSNTINFTTSLTNSVNDEVRRLTRFPSVMHLEGDHFDAELFRYIARDVDVRLTVSRACPRLAELQHIFKGPQNPWLLRIVDNI